MIKIPRRRELVFLQRGGWRFLLRGASLTGGAFCGVTHLWGVALFVV
ncbi:MAG: hypothetical protein RR060_03215 [Victivallaceae bacterium]